MEAVISLCKTMPLPELCSSFHQNLQHLFYALPLDHTLIVNDFFYIMYTRSTPLIHKKKTVNEGRICKKLQYVRTE
jgi:hypothetical protein